VNTDAKYALSQLQRQFDQLSAPTDAPVKVVNLRPEVATVVDEIQPQPLGMPASIVVQPCVESRSTNGSNFNPFAVVAVAVAVAIANLISLDGGSNWLEGALLLATYIVIGAGFYFILFRGIPHPMPVGDG